MQLSVFQAFSWKLLLQRVTKWFDGADLGLVIFLFKIINRGFYQLFQDLHIDICQSLYIETSFCGLMLSKLFQQIRLFSEAWHHIQG